MLIYLPLQLFLSVQSLSLAFGAFTSSCSPPSVLRQNFVSPIRSSVPTDSLFPPSPWQPASYCVFMNLLTLMFFTSSGQLLCRKSSSAGSACASWVEFGGSDVLFSEHSIGKHMVLLHSNSVWSRDLSPTLFIFLLTSLFRLSPSPL